jgi:hypothetical protein
MKKKKQGELQSILQRKLFTCKRCRKGIPFKRDLEREYCSTNPLGQRHWGEKYFPLERDTEGKNTPFQKRLRTNYGEKRSKNLKQGILHRAKGLVNIFQLR